MRLVTGPYARPTACAVLNREDGELVDFQAVIDRPEPTLLHLKRELVEEAAELCGMVPGDEVAALRAQMDQFGAQLDELKETMRMTGELESCLNGGTD